MSKSTTRAPLDSLTGLPAAAACRAEVAVHAAGGAFALGLLDLDWFGKQNAQSGREAGDQSIKAAADHLTAQFDGSGKTFRFGGDALMVLMPKLEKEQAFLQLEHARQRFVDDRTDGLTFSGGVAAAPDDGTDPEALIRKCSEALYRAKLSGRNKICLAREEKMVTKTVHYRQGQLEGLSRLAKREEMNEASLLREALDDLLRKYNA